MAGTGQCNTVPEKFYDRLSLNANLSRYTVPSDPEDPNFDLEKYLEKVSNDSP